MNFSPYPVSQPQFNGTPLFSGRDWFIARPTTTSIIALGAPNHHAVERIANLPSTQIEMRAHFRALVGKVEAEYLKSMRSVGESEDTNSKVALP